MAGAGGIEGLHAIDGTCDLCGEQCDSETQELNALTCTFAPNCPEEASCYHQDCLERYLKNIRCEKNRKTGFKCPRGCGKGTKYDEPCRGKIDKSHPIHVRNDNNKKRKKAKMPEVSPEVVPRFGPAAKAARAKEREEEKAKQKKAAAAAAAAAAARTVTAVPTKAKAAAVKKESLASAAAAARRELGLGGGGGGSAAKAPKAPSAACLHNDVAASRTASRSAPSPAAAPASSAWGAVKASAAKPPAAKPSAPALSSADAFPAVAMANKASAPPAKGPWAGTAATKSAATTTSANGVVNSMSTARTINAAGALPLNDVAARLASSTATVAPPAEVQKVSKAFKKNMRRAERKRDKETEASVTSEPSPPLTPHKTAGLTAQQSANSSPARRGCSPTDSTLPASPQASQSLPALDLDAGSDINRCLQVMEVDQLGLREEKPWGKQVVAMYKLQQAAQQLQQLGWQEWQAVLAVNLCGAVLPAAAWLLDDAGGGRASCLADAQKLLNDAVEREALPKVDVTHEAEQVEAAATALDVPLPTVCGEISRSGGDLRAALVMLSSQSPTQQQRPRSHGASNSQQQHQRQVSLQDLGLASLSRPGTTPLVDPQDPEVATTKAHVSGPIGPSPGAAPGRSNFGSRDGGCSAAASQQAAGAGAAAILPPLPTGRQVASSGFESSAAPSATDSVSNMHSRVSSFDVLSVGAPWSELLSNTTSAELLLDGQHKTQTAPEGCSSFTQGLRLQQQQQQQQQQTSMQSPFGVSPLTHDASGRRVGFAHHHHHHSSSLFGSPAASFSGPAGAAGAGLTGLEHYASALSSQPSWASTSSNLWGGTLPGSSGSGLPGGIHGQAVDFPGTALLTAAAGEAKHGGRHARMPSSGAGGNSAINDSELNALMATLMCR